MALAVGDLSGENSETAEAFLAAVGEDAWPLLRDVSADPSDPEAAGRARSILFLAGQETDLSIEAMVDLLLADLNRAETYPYLGIRAIHLLGLLGDEAAPALAARARESSARGESARRLLLLRAEEP